MFADICDYSHICIFVCNEQALSSYMCKLNAKTFVLIIKFQCQKNNGLNSEG